MMNNKLLIGCIYRHHDSTVDEDRLLFEALKKIAAQKHSQVVLWGDFNLPNIDWSSWMTGSNNLTRDFKFIECICDCYFHQHITDPIQGQGTDRSSVLDLIFTDESETVSKIVLEAPLGKSDHSVLKFRDGIPCY